MNLGIASRKGELIKWAISACFAIAVLLLPEQGLLTHQFKTFLAITVLCLALAAFELVPEFFIAIVMPSLWIYFGVAETSVVMSSWVGTTMLMLCGAFFLGAALDDCGLLRRIAYTIMCKVKGSYFKLLASVMVVGVILNILSSGQAYCIIAPLAAGLCLSLNEMKTKVGAGIAAAAMIGGCTAHAYTYQASAWGVIMKAGANYIGPTEITPLSIMIHCWPMFFVSLFIVWIISKWYKPDKELGEVVYFQEQLALMGKVTRKEKANILIMALVLVYIFTVGVHKMDVNLGFALLPWLLFLPGIDGADTNTFKKMNVTMLFFIASCMSIGAVASSMGMADALREFCTAILQGNNSPTAIMGIIFAIVFVLNFLMTPLAIFSLTIEPMSALALSAGLSPIPFAYAVNACSEAIILPYEYVPYLVIYAFGMISSIDFIKINIMRSIVFFAGFLLVLVPYWKLIGLF